MLSQLTQTTMLFIQKTLNACDQCPGFIGAALASPDGLILALHGDLPGDEAAACASSLFVEATTSLSYIGQSAPRVMMIWTESKIISFARLNDGSIFFVLSSEMSKYDAVLKTTSSIALKLNHGLKMLG